MAAGLAITSENSNRNYNGKVTPYLIISCIMAATGGIIFGYDNGISGLVQSSPSLICIDFGL